MTRGKPCDPQLSINGLPMAWIKDKPFKFLGKQTLANASDTAARKKMEQTINDGVAKIDALPLTGVQKMWIFDAVLMSKLSWDFMVHDTTTTWIATHLGSIQTEWYKKWSHYPKHGVVSIFYRSTKRFGLQMKEMMPFFKKQQLIKCHLLKTSSDQEVRMVYEARAANEKKLSKPISSKTERFKAQFCQPVFQSKAATRITSKIVQNRWRPCVELENLLSEVKYNSMFGCGVRAGHDKRGLGCDPKLKKKKGSATAEERAAVLEILDEKIDEQRYLHATQLAHFGEWCKWDGIMAQDKIWQAAIYDYNDTLFQWTIKAIEDQCPSPQVLKCWRLIENANCPVCSAAGCSLKHILAGCKTALNQNRYLWRHDSILLAIYQTVREAVNHGRARLKQGISERPSQTTFVSSQGNRMHSHSILVEALFESSDDWTVQFDLDVPEDGQMKNQPFPAHIGAVAKRPDGLVYSDKLKKLVYIELTSPWEENMTKSHFNKFEKYRKDGIHSIEGWTVIPLCVEVGSRGTTNQSWQQMCVALGLKRAQNKALRKRVINTARRCSYFLWLNRKCKEWCHPKLLQ